MEPMEKAKRDERIQRAAALGISLEELLEDDDSSQTSSNISAGGDAQEATDIEAMEIDPALDLTVGEVEPTPLQQEFLGDDVVTPQSYQAFLSISLY